MIEMFFNFLENKENVIPLLFGFVCGILVGFTICNFIKYSIFKTKCDAINFLETPITMHLRNGKHFKTSCHFLQENKCSKLKSYCIYHRPKKRFSKLKNKLKNLLKIPL
ncbi:hypothetical protein A0M39_05090 [Campylobacter jejuni]|nr:hypothetical protein TM01_03775 [Campylobacter jejuni subsp. jejuni]OEW19758.1 hypothetical protein AJ939_08275 [Campylobacter sp. BCW_6889]OEW23815.1 hypothetical protein AJ874_08880 [Campylobacter jejuni]OEW26311.1 hypothetical protein AJ877_08755 [Campylobacter jejuni]OKY03360.1 hypothetical protein A0M39_05090 [Campylobacter jejuni]